MRSLRAAAAIVMICCASLAHAEGGATVTGIVEDALMHPLEGATVVIHDPAGNTIAKLVTGKDGKFAFPNVAFGDYTVEANSPGLVGDHQHLQINAPEVAAVE